MKSISAIKLMIGLLSIVILFHVSILVKLVPYGITWGGRLKNDTEMYVFETLSITINLFLAFILLMKGNYIKFQFKEKVVNIILWIFFFIFILNTIGNIFAKTTFEKLLSLLTLIFAILIWNIQKIKKSTII